MRVVLKLGVIFSAVLISILLCGRATAQQKELADAANFCTAALLNSYCKGYTEELLASAKVAMKPEDRETLQNNLARFTKMSQQQANLSRFGKHRSWTFTGQPGVFRYLGRGQVRNFLSGSSDIDKLTGYYSQVCLARDNSTFTAELGRLSGICSGIYSEWTTYTGERYGFSVEYPAYLLKEQKAPHNNDGRTFLSENGSASLVVFGRFNTDEWADAKAMKAGLLASGNYTDLSYEQAKEGWVVLSGTRGDVVYYEKYVLSCKNKIINSIILNHLSEDTDRFSDITKRIAMSLKPGIGLETPEEAC